MLHFMKLGGALMWPILFLGLASIGLSLREARAEGEGARSKRLAVAMLSLSIGWSLLGVLVTLTHAQEAPAEILVTGVGESCAPAALGFLLYGAWRLASSVRRAVA